MAVTFVLGRAGSGKTRYCLDALLAELERPEDRRLILLVPEQAGFQMERALATRAARGGYSRAAVVGFSRLAQRILSEIGGAPVQLRAGARALALRGAVLRMGKSLRFFHQSAQTPGFYTQLAGLLEELLREGIEPDDLQAAARSVTDAALKRKLAEIVRLSREYLAWLGPARLDPALRLAALRERLVALPWLPAASIWVDGFAGFTGQELATLVALARAARDLTITLLLDPAAPAVSRPDVRPDPLSLFQCTEQTYQRLCELFTQFGVPCGPPVMLHGAPLPRFVEAPALARLEAGLATPIGVPPDASAVAGPSNELRVLECTTPRDELRQAARFIRQNIADSAGKLRFRDFAVIARDLEPLSPMVAEVFGEYGLPYFLDRRRPMRAHPLCRVVEALFAALRTDFSVPAMTRLLRTGLLPLTRAQAEELENTVAAHAVHGLASWLQPAWDFSRDLLRGFDAAESNARPKPHAAPDQSLDAARLALVAIFQPLLRLTEADPPPTGAVWSRAIYDVFTALGARRRIEDWIAEGRGERGWERAETHRLAWEAVCGVLDDVHDVLPDSPLGADEIATILSSALREQTLGLAPPTLDQVLVSAIERSRHPEIKYAWLLAFNEGVFPARPAEDKLLTTVERDALAQAGMPLPASRDEAFGERLLAYIALTRPSCGLTISYATVGVDGGPLLPSPLLDDVLRALPGLTVQRVAAHEPPVCLAEMARGYLHARPNAAAQPCAWRRFERLAVRVGHSERAVELAWLLRGVSCRNAAETVPSAGPRADSVAAWDGSPSEVETYLDCSFKHFVKYRLRLDPQRAPRPMSWDLGAAAHGILAEVTRRAQTETQGARGWPDDRWLTLLDAVIDSFEQALPADLSQRRPELAFQARQLRTFLAEVVLVHADRWRRGMFAPVACEQEFAGAGNAPVWPALEWQMPGGQRFWLHGRIDRVDCCRAGDHKFLLVYDYKSSTASVGGVFLTGARLQLFSYLLAVRRAFARESDVHLAGVFLAPLYPDPRALESQYAQAAQPAEQRMYLYRPRGLFTRDVARLLDGQLGEAASPVAAMKLKKDGDFNRAASRDVITPDELEQRMDLAERTILLAAKGILSGAVEPAPLVEDRTLACTRCEFRAVCRFDRALNRVRAAEKILPTLDSAGASEQGDEA